MTVNNYSTQCAVFSTFIAGRRNAPGLSSGSREFTARPPPTSPRPGLVEVRKQLDLSCPVSQIENPESCHRHQGIHPLVLKCCETRGGSQNLPARKPDSSFRCRNILIISLINSFYKRARRRRKILRFLSPKYTWK